MRFSSLMTRKSVKGFTQRYHYVAGTNYLCSREDRRKEEHRVGAAVRYQLSASFERTQVHLLTDSNALLAAAQRI